MGAGRFICLGVPFALTFASLVCQLIVFTGLNPNKSYFFATFNTANLSVSASSLTTRSLAPISLDARDGSGIAHLTSEALANTGSSSSSSNTGSNQGIAHLTSEALANSGSSSSASSALDGVTITAANLGLADSYTVGLWSYCAITNDSGHVTQNCSSPKAEFWFDPFSIWNLNTTSAESAINSTVLTDALKTYKTASKWTWVAYVIALIFTIGEILFGVVAIFSKIGSCITTIVSAIGSVAIVAASVLATIMWSIVVASFNKELKKYGLTAEVSTKMLSVTWLAVAFSVASGFFWMISVCCCGSTDRTYSRGGRRSNNRNSDQEKLVPMNGPYAQVHHEPAFVSNPYAGQPTIYNPPTQQGFGGQEYGQASGINAKPIRDLNTAYEPYRHDHI